MNDRLLSLLGLSRKAGKVQIGFDPVKDAIETGKAELVLTAADISANTAGKIKAAAEQFGVELICINRSKEELSFALGKTCALVAVTDKGFSKRLKELTLAECNEGGNDL